jgi:hypothetical protein
MVESMSDEDCMLDVGIERKSFRRQIDFYANKIKERDDDRLGIKKKNL